MNKIESLDDLFSMVGCRATYYDLGRRIRKLPPKQVIQFDRKQQIYPYPFRQNAWLACLLEQAPSKQAKANQETVIWFIKLPLDEAGCLNLGTRDHFIKSIVDKILHKEDADLSEALEDSPYTFKPDQERMASFHAILGKQLSSPESHYFHSVMDYLKNELPDETGKWQSIGLQGIAELATKTAEEAFLFFIQKAIDSAPKPFVSALCHALEHEKIPEALENQLIKKLTEEKEGMIQASYIRALSVSDLNNDLLLPLFALLGDITKCSDDEIHLIAALSAKCPHWLSQNPQLLRVIMEKLAHRQDGNIAFKQITMELSQHPETQKNLWTLLRSPHVSSSLAQAVSHLFMRAPSSIQ